jgi:hypothetical protein
MAKQFSIEVEGLEQLQWRINSLPDQAKAEILDAVSSYSLEVLRKEQPSYRHVTRARAYGMQRGGEGWFSDKQRRYVMAKIRSGEIRIPYNRTGRLVHGWAATRTTERVTFGNAVPYAPYVIGFAAQSRHERLVGWKTITDTMRKLSFQSAPFRKACMDAVQKAIRKLQLG